MTDGGYTPIKQIRLGDKVWSRNAETGVMGWQSVQAHYSNHYPETVKVAIRDLEQEMTQQIISNKIHPFFVQVPAGAIVPPSPEGHDYQGVLANGHTYFVRGAPTPSDQPVAANDNQAIWIHNNCGLEKLSNSAKLQNKKTEFGGEFFMGELAR